MGAEAAVLSKPLSAVEDRLSLERSTGYAQASVGFIIPAGNRLIERQFNRFAPPELGVHVARLQMNGRYRKPLPQLLEAVAQAARTLADARVDLIGFHCTANSMENEAGGNWRIRDAIVEATGIPAVSTGEAVVEALEHLAIKRMVLVTPYAQAANDHEREFLHELGYEVVHDVALAAKGNPGPSYLISPARWISIVRDNLRAEADAYFLSCANTTQIDTIVDLEAELGKPVVNSNQAMLWACLNRLKGRLPPLAPIPALGRLMRN